LPTSAELDTGSDGASATEGAAESGASEASEAAPAADEKMGEKVATGVKGGDEKAKGGDEKAAKADDDAYQRQIEEQIEEATCVVRREELRAKLRAAAPNLGDVYKKFASNADVGISRSEFRSMLAALEMAIPHRERKVQ
jgi:hypothetical protein